MGKARRKNVKTALNTYNPTNLLMYLRVYYGLTQTALAKATGLKVNDISRFELGHPNMWFGKLKALAFCRNITHARMMCEAMSKANGGSYDTAYLTGCSSGSGRFSSRPSLCEE